MYIAERLELYFVANGVTEAERKRAVLLTVSGPSTYKLIRNLTAPERPAEVAYSEIVALVKAHHAYAEAIRKPCSGINFTHGLNSQERVWQRL